MEMSAAISAVCFTAMHALALANYYPNRGSNFQNKKVLIHSAAGGVGSMLVALSHYYGAQKIVGEYIFAIICTNISIFLCLVTTKQLALTVLFYSCH